MLEGVAFQLSDLQINLVVEQYLKEMARYEGAARHVEQRLRRELREAAIPTLLSSRAKHPEDLREKLRRKRADPRYALDALLKNLNHIVTDVAGCRVVVYDPRQASIAADVVRRSFALWRRSERADEVLDKSTGYKAIHMLVLLDKDIELALAGAICEVQVTSIACHAFNELEHDIAYKMKGVAPGSDVQRYTKDAFYAARLLDAMVERLADGRAREIASSARTIESSEDLRFVLERILDRPISGEVERLLRLLRGLLETVTARWLEGAITPQLLADGTEIAGSHGIYDADEVMAIALGLIDRFGPEFRDLASQWRGPSTPLKRAILKVTEP